MCWSFSVTQSGLTHLVNFDNFLYALLTLFRVATGDNWTDLMFACAVQVGQWHTPHQHSHCTFDTRSITNASWSFHKLVNKIALCKQALIGHCVHPSLRTQPPHCDRDAGDCGSLVAYPYFLSFTLLVPIVMLNLFTAVIIENFEKQHEQEEWRLNPEHLEEFVGLWWVSGYRGGGNV